VDATCALLKIPPRTPDKLRASAVTLLITLLSFRLSLQVFLYDLVLARMLVFSLIAVVFSSVFVPSLATPCTRTYTVREGDICDSISAANNVSTYQLAVENPGINLNCTNLLPGQSLCLGTSGEDCTTTYVVKPNDDCDVVSSAYNINSTVLSLNNPQLNGGCSNLYVGEVLCVAGTVIVPPVHPGDKTPATQIPTTAPPARPQHTGHPNPDDDDDDLPWCD